MQEDQNSYPANGAERYAAGQRATWISAALNVALTVAQLIVGWLANSQSLVAHGLHSFSDLLSDFLVLYANRKGADPADLEHPYGHARFETAATLILGLSLVGIGLGILVAAADKLQHAEAIAAVEMAALWVAIGTAAGKEALFHYLKRVAERLRSPMLMANAWHTRADAASALVVVVGIAGSLLGWRMLDLVAAAIMGFMILHMGGKLAYEAIRELIDTGLPAATVESIRATLAGTPGVLGLHELRTRRMAHQALVDAHVLVDPRISVSEGHRVAESARQRVLKAHPEVLDVLVHVDPEDDLVPPENPQRLPERAELEIHLRAMLGAVELDRITFHYLGQQVEAEVFLVPALAMDPVRIADLEQRLAERLPGDPYFSAVSLNCRVAPK
jgi:cation diffusion facilitator family transporter